MELKEIKAIIDLMTRNNLSEFELEKADCKIRMKRNLDGEVTSYITPQTHQMLQAPPQIQTNVSNAPVATTPVADHLPTINSPMVGTFYASPAPGSPAYVNVGQEVNEDTVVCIIEAMKVMNEIKAEMKGIMTQMMVENGKPVEFGTPLFKIKPL
jgi:acetyl-CoA carboxylase biotin carboxyl carrier protein